MPAPAAESPPSSGTRQPLLIDGPPAGVPPLGDSPAASLFPGAGPEGSSGEFSLFRAGRWLLGRAAAAADEDLPGTVARLYGELLLAIGDLHLCRTWNFVPDINAPGPGGLENYRAFSSGRSLAFERHFGRGFKRRLPASSAVGTAGGGITVAFAAADAVPRHLENPVQVPAYDYPPQHGPRPPSFSRATVVPEGGRSDVFIAGTAAIRGHETMAPGNTGAQLAVTLENLRLISRVTGLGDDLGAGRCAARHLRVYLRNAADLQAVEAMLARHLLKPGDAVGYFRADICRAALNVEIEVSVLGSKVTA